VRITQHDTEPGAIHGKIDRRRSMQDGLEVKKCARDIFKFLCSFRKRVRGLAGSSFLQWRFSAGGYLTVGNYYECAAGEKPFHLGGMKRQWGRIVNGLLMSLAHRS